MRLILLLSAASVALGVKRHEFKTCDQSGFCKRNRALADRAEAAGNAWVPPFFAEKGAVDDQGVYAAKVGTAAYPEATFGLRVGIYDTGAVRVTMDEVGGLHQRYNEGTAAAFVDGWEPAWSALSVSGKTGVTTLESGTTRVVIQESPLVLRVFSEGREELVFGESGLLNMEHYRTKESPETSIEKYANSDELRATYWEESFGGKTDTKKRGPESWSVDVTFKGYKDVYGIPQHASSLSLKETRKEQKGPDGYSDPYRLYNTDVFEYEHDSEMSIYGSVPFMHALKSGDAVGVYFATKSETWIDITKSANDVRAHWMAESGVLDAFVFLSKKKKARASPVSQVLQQFMAFAGHAMLPPLFALGYHQCRWNYQSVDDVLTVQQKFEDADIPLDVIWLDIEYAKDHEYFIWDRRYFQNPLYMLDELDKKGRQLVAIVDPHVKRDDGLYVFTESRDQDLLIKGPDGKDYEGWCWTGSSVWPDFFNPKTWSWWRTLFKYDKFVDSARNLWIWHDMSEPAIFNGPEVTLQKDALHYGGWEHRDVHNANGLMSHLPTVQAVRERDATSRRPFVLTRSFYTGSQRAGPHWTGDNLGDWEHLNGTLAMLLQNNIGGNSWTGADVGGFFGNPPEDMLVRWYQVGVLMPFFRAHAHIDTRRREPYLFDEPNRGFLRDMLRLRYSMLPIWRTEFARAHRTGLPILRPLYVEYPDDSATFKIDDEAFLGATGLLAKPVTEKNVDRTVVYLPKNVPYYHYFSHDIYKGASRVDVSAPLHSLPLFIEGGHIIPKYDIIRRSAVHMWKDPLTLVVALDNKGTAQGDIYLDDGESYDADEGHFVWRQASFSQGTLSWDIKTPPTNPYTKHTVVNELPAGKNTFADKITDVVLDKIVILGVTKAPACALVFTEDGQRRVDVASFENAGAASDPLTKQRASELTLNGVLLPAVSTGTTVKLVYSETECSGAGVALPPVDWTPVDTTGTCPQGRFMCANKGFVPGCILPERVNDGVCDEECCDGSDETDGKTACSNVCAEKAAASAKIAKEENTKLKKGNAIRLAAVKAGQKAKDEVAQRRAAIQEEIEATELAIEDADIALSKAEQTEGMVFNEHMNSPLFSSISELKQAVSQLREQRDFLQEDVNRLQEILVDLSNNANPEDQNEAAIKATRQFDDWQNEYAKRVRKTEKSGRYFNSARLDVGILGANHLILMDEFIRDALHKSTERSLARSKDTGLLHSAKKLAYKVLPSGWLPYDASDLSAVSTAEETKKSLEKDLLSLKADLKNTGKELEAEWGPGWEWHSLRDKCIEAEFGEYVYKLCHFGDATQVSNSGHGTVSLGKFDKWITPYSHALYDKGQRCWNGPQRSVNVHITCGVEDALVKVSEPEKCEYQYDVTSPLACVLPDDEKEL